MRQQTKSLLGIMLAPLKKNFKKMEEEVSVVLQRGHWATTTLVVRTQANNSTNNCNNNYAEERRKRYEASKAQKFTLLGDIMKNILALLVAQKKITKLLPPTSLSRRNHDPIRICSYHSRSWALNLGMLGLETSNPRPNRSEEDHSIDRGNPQCQYKLAPVT